MRTTREPRVVTRCRVCFERLDQQVVAESEDLSRRGIFVRTDELLPVGSVVELEITLPEGLTFRVISRVAHLLSPSAARALGRRTGMGFEFLEEDNDGRDALVAYLDELLEELTPPPMTLPGAQRVVIVDDREPLLDRLSEALEGAGFRVEAFASGAEAYTACAEAVPDILVAATDMTGTDGWTLVKMFAVKPHLVDVPIVLMSDDGSDMTRLQAYRAGARDFIHKPFTEEELIIRLRRIVMSRPRHADGVTLRGNLAEISVQTLLSMLEFERKSGILVLLRGVEISRLFVASGRVVEVDGGGDDTQPARERIMRILDWQDGNFEFAACEVVGRDEIGMPTGALLLEHARIRDEQRGG